MKNLRVSASLRLYKEAQAVWLRLPGSDWAGPLRGRGACWPGGGVGPRAHIVGLWQRLARRACQITHVRIQIERLFEKPRLGG
jgi:hypothetical protein